MTDYSNIKFFRSLPNRDEALDQVFKFLQALAQKNPALAETYIFIKNMDFFREVLHKGLTDHLTMVIEDEEWEAMEKMDLSLEIDDPYLRDEDQMLPEFSGNQFVMQKDEQISILLFLRGQITPVRLHFQLTELDELFYLRLVRITAK